MILVIINVTLFLRLTAGAHPSKPIFVSAIEAQHVNGLALRHEMPALDPITFLA
jgi:hypothetical protein